MIKKYSNEPNEFNGKLLDPEPISTAAFVIASISAMAAVTQLLYSVRNLRLENEAKLRKFKSIIAQSRKVSEQLVEDVELFERIWKPSIIVSPNGNFTIWDLNPYEYRSKKQMLTRVTSAYKKLEDLQNQLGRLDLDELGDSCRVHSIESSQELFKKLSSIDSVGDFAGLSREIKHRSINYREVIESIEWDLNQRVEG